MTNDKEVVANRIEKKVLSGSEFLHSELCYLSAGTNLTHLETSRIADRLVQKLRKQNLLTFVRRGRNFVWSLTDEGKKYATKRNKEL